MRPECTQVDVWLNYKQTNKQLDKQQVVQKVFLDAGVCLCDCFVDGDKLLSGFWGGLIEYPATLHYIPLQQPFPKSIVFVISLLHGFSKHVRLLFCNLPGVT